ncbi:MAG TPA: LPS export ABC transporter periplasmic protein LptC [Saprospiraceae bacterium]|nr:LPS export ABC transporter periplasmic protein LptC [Saprospiraceae bacterium]HNT21036.1 LPS export ABC transporter periplasmic protein LptC [Saprospiraceae bacterium]
MLRYLGSLAAILFLGACENDFNLLQEAHQKKGNEEMVRDVVLHYTDSGRLEVLLKAPVIKRTLQNNIPKQEFTEGIYCEFYDDSLRLKARLTARYAIRDENKRIMTARDQVVLVSADSTRLESEELIWDEGRAIVYSNKFVKWSRGKEVGTGFFFQADQSFKKIQMRKTEADNIVIPGLGRDEE